MDDLAAGERRELEWERLSTQGWTRRRALAADLRRSLRVKLRATDAEDGCAENTGETLLARH
jgi:hypothetical protein